MAQKKKTAWRSKQTRWDDAVGKLQSMTEEAVRDVEALQSFDSGDDLDDIQEVRNQRRELEIRAENTLDKLRSSGAEQVEDIRSVHEELETWRENLPENLDPSPTAEKLDDVVDQDFPSQLDDVIEQLGDDLIEDVDTIEEQLQELEEIIGEAEGADMPLGFGRD